MGYERYKGIEYQIYECAKWAVQCALCDFETGTRTKREAEYWMKSHITEKHADAKARG